MINKLKFETIKTLTSHFSHQWKQPLNILSLNNTSLEIMDLTDTYSKQDIKQIIASNKIALDFIISTLDGINQYGQFDTNTSCYLLKDFITRLIENFQSIKSDDIVLYIDNQSDDIEMKNMEKTLEFILENIFLKLINFPINKIDLAISNDEKNLNFIFTTKSEESLTLKKRILEHTSNKEVNSYTHIGFELIELAINTILDGKIEIIENNFSSSFKVTVPIKV